MRKTIPGVLLVLCTAMLSACASYVTSNVTAFQDWRGSDQERSYRFDRAPQQQDDLEQRAYERLVDAELSTYGFRLAPDGAARYAVSLSYGQHDTVDYAPQAAYAYGGFAGGWGRRGWGPGWGGWGAWGPPPIVDMPYAARASSLTIRIRALDGPNGTGHEVYKVTARHVGDPVALPVVMPYLVRSALADFPMPNGLTKDVRLPLERRVGGAVINEVSVPATPAGGSAASPASGPAAATSANGPAATSANGSAATSGGGAAAASASGHD